MRCKQPHASDPQSAATRIAFLRNVLLRVPEYRNDLAIIKPPPGEEAQPFTHFLKMESPSFTPAPADTAISFSSNPVPNVPPGKWSWIGAVSLNGEGAPAIVLANEKEVRIGNASSPFPGGSSAEPPREGISALDFNYDFKTDFALAGDGGLRLLKQENAGKFTDVTAQTKLPASILNASYTGAWAADIDADGDLDIVLGAESVQPTVLQNNGDGSFAEGHPFAGVSGLRSFVWADIDGDGDPDAGLIDDKNKLHVFANQRSGQFKERALPSTLPPVRTISAAEVNSDSVLDLIAVQADGIVIRLSDKNEGQEWDTAEIARLNTAPNYLEGRFGLTVADLDNNGGNDLLLVESSISRATANAAGALIWLSDEQGKFHGFSNAAGPRSVFGAADVNGDGRLDLMGLTNEGQPIQAINHGTKNYHWQVIRPRAAQATGDQRINSFGIGGEMEIRAGLASPEAIGNGSDCSFWSRRSNRRRRSAHCVAQRSSAGRV